MLRILFWLVVLGLCFLAGVMFSAPNLQGVTLSFYVGSAELPLAVLLFAALAAGALLGVVLNLAWVLRLRRENRGLRKHARQLERETAELRLHRATHD